MNETREYRVYASRWLVLAVYMLANLTVQTLWIAYAPITHQAMAYYGASELQVGLLAMVFMIAFIPFSLPASWLIDRFGFYPSVAAGAAIVAICGLLRGFAGPNYALALAATMGMAAAQPLFLNSWTKVASAWFPAGERATAVGLITLANLLGAGAGTVLSPILAEGMPIARIQLMYGIAAAVTAVLFIAIAREKPATPPDASAEGERALMVAGIKRAMSMKHFRRYLVIAFVGLGIFNGISTWVEGIVVPRGFSSGQAGIVVAVMLVAGVIGAVVIPALSDRAGKRRRFIIIGLAGAIPGLVGIALAQSLPLLLASSFVLGFFLVSVNPVGTQYATDIALPTPEGSSNGLIALAGQISVVLVYAMEPLKGATGSYTLPLLCLAVLLVGTIGLAATLKEPSALRAEREEGQQGAAPTPGQAPNRI
jgi:MFS family permease